LGGDIQRQVDGDATKRKKEKTALKKKGTAMKPFL